MSLITFNQVSKEFISGKGTAITAVDNFTLSIAKNEFISIVGPSGCGKTTCLRMLAGFEKPSKGEILVNGKAITKPGPDRAVVFQQFALFPWKTINDNIEFALESREKNPKERQKIIDYYLDLMKLTQHRNAFPHQLSGGMQQRVAIARAYSLDPQVLLMDEPFGALDAQTRVVMQEELIKITRSNPRTVLFITHAVEEAIYLADRVIIMSARPGKIKEIIEINPLRKADKWEECPQIEDVMNIQSFISLKTHIWKSLRSEH